MQCNIDAKGKRIRFVYGIILVIIGILASVLWAYSSGSALRWVVSIAVMASGAFVLFEARQGWCALRALGFKTSV
jgi:hypothetical protein